MHLSCRSEYGIDPTDNFETYIAAFYWAAMTMTTVGFGDVVSAATPLSQCP